MHVFRLTSGQKGKIAAGPFELVVSDRNVLAALKLNKLNAVSLDAAFVDFVKSVSFVADHLFEVLRVSP